MESIFYSNNAITSKKGEYRQFLINCVNLVYIMPDNKIVTIKVIITKSSWCQFILDSQTFEVSN